MAGRRRPSGRELLSPSLRASLLDAAVQGARHLLALAAAPLNGTLLLPHEEEGAGLHTYYLGWCAAPRLEPHQAGPAREQSRRR